MLVHFYDVFIPKHSFDPEPIAKLKEVYASHDKFRKMVEPGAEDKERVVDLSYRASWPRSVSLLATLIEETTYSRTHDGCLKVALKARKVPEETLEYERYKERVMEILDALVEEKKEKARLAKEEQDRNQKVAATDSWNIC